MRPLRSHTDGRRSADAGTRWLVLVVALLALCICSPRHVHTLGSSTNATGRSAGKCCQVRRSPAPVRPAWEFTSSAWLFRSCVVSSRWLSRPASVGSTLLEVSARIGSQSSIARGDRCPERWFGMARFDVEGTPQALGYLDEIVHEMAPLFPITLDEAIGRSNRAFRGEGLLRKSRCQSSCMRNRMCGPSTSTTARKAAGGEGRRVSSHFHTRSRPARAKIRRRLLVVEGLTHDACQCLPRTFSSAAWFVGVEGGEGGELFAETTSVAWQTAACSSTTGGGELRCGFRSRVMVARGTDGSTRLGEAR